MAQQPPLKKPKRVHPWRNEYAREFGVRVLDRDAVSGDVLVVECRFCAVFGREERVLEGDEGNDGAPVSGDKAQATPAPIDKNPDSETASGRSSRDTDIAANKNTNSSNSNSNNTLLREKKSRARTRSIATWKKSFRSDNMRSHHLEQHPRKWREYQQLLFHVKKEQALQGFQLYPPANGSDGDGGHDGDRGAELLYTQQLSAFFGDPTSSANESLTDPVVVAAAAAAASAPQLSAPSRRERKVPRTKTNTRSNSAPAQPAQKDQDKDVLQVADSSTQLLILTEITSLAIVDELVPSLFDTPLEGEDCKAKMQIDGSSADHKSGNLPPSRTTPASSSSVVVLHPVYNGESATSIVQVSNGSESISNGEGTATAPADLTVSQYGITLKSVSEYSYVRQLLALGDGVTFDQIAKIVAISRAQFNLETRLTGASQDDIREYAKLVVAADLQMISDMMRGSWTYSLALQSSVPGSDAGEGIEDCVEGGPAIEVRVRFPSSSGTDVEDFHLVSVPYPSPVESAADHRFSSADAAALITKALSVVDPQWQKKLIGVCDEAPIRSMVVVSSVADVIEEAATGPFHRVLRGAQLVEASLLKALDGLLASTEKGASDQAASVGVGFLEQLDAVILYLHGQNQWSTTHGVCPNLCANKRLSTPWLLLATLQWLVTRRELIGQLQSEIEPPQPEAKLSAEWWVMCLALCEILSDCQSIYVTLSNRDGDTDKTEQQQRPLSPRAILAQFVQDQTLKLGVSQVERIRQVDQFEAGESSLRLKRFLWTKNGIVTFFRSLNLSTRRLYSQLSPEEQASVVHQVGRFVLQSLDVISACTSKRASKPDDASDIAGTEDAIPPTRPLDFVAIERGAVVDFIEHHSARLELSFDLAFIDGASKQIKDLRDLVAGNGKIKASLVDAHAKSFREAWEPVQGFSSTRALAAGFATAMPRSHEPATQPTGVSRSRLASRSSLQTEVQVHALQIEDVEKAYKLFQVGTSTPSL